MIINSRDEFVIAQRKDGEYKREMSMSPKESKNNGSGTKKIVRSLDLNNASYPSSQATKIPATGANQNNSSEKFLPEYITTRPQSFGGAGLKKEHRFVFRKITNSCSPDDHSDRCFQNRVGSYFQRYEK